jgi:ribA/ribD-fused uncharacterized protein
MQFNDYRQIENRVFFIGSFLSNWYVAPFVSEIEFRAPIAPGNEGIPSCSGAFEFNCVEQLMMAAKATIFGDLRTFLRIMDVVHPADQKRLGREVAGYDDAIWSASRKEIVKRGIRDKFEQNENMKQAMLGFPADTEFVETNRWDNIWGIGLSIDDPNIADKSKWNGQNLLGVILTEIHQEFLDEIK